MSCSNPGNKTFVPATRKPNPAGCAGGNPCAASLRH